MPVKETPVATIPWSLGVWLRRAFSYILLSVQCLSDLYPGLVPVHCGKAPRGLLVLLIVNLGILGFGTDRGNPSRMCQEASGCAWSGLHVMPAFVPHPPALLHL